MLAASTQDTDKGFILMHEIEANQDISQRELSQKTGLSLGTVNLLLQKMIKQGLIKMETIPANRVIYMLTPIGLAEKAIKTVHYIKNHYQIIQATKNRIQHKIEQFHQQYDVIYICLPGNELDSLVQAAVDEYLAKHSDRYVRTISISQALHPDELPVSDNAIIFYLPEDALSSQTVLQTASSIPLVSLADML